MPETGTLLVNYILPIAVLLDLICTILAYVFLIASIIAMKKSASQRKNRFEHLNWRLKVLKYTKIWTLLYAIASVSGVTIGLAVGQKVLMYGNFLVGVLFAVFFLVIRQAHQIVLKEFNSAKAILGG